MLSWHRPEAFLSSTRMLSAIPGLDRMYRRPQISFESERLRRFSTLNEEEQTKSNRQKFRELPVNASVLGFIRKIGVGIPPSKRKLRRSVNLSLNPLQRANRGGSQAERVPESRDKRSITSPPPPFGPGSRVRVIASCTDATQFPQHQTSRDIPEVALAGRSNVGKSTLLNALLYGNKYRPGFSKGDKAAMSSRPGETREITFYQLSSPTSQPTGNPGASSSKLLRLVDLPGYGFAYASPEQAVVFQTLMKEYLLHRGGKTLKRVLLLLDARHGMKKSDVDFLNVLQEDRLELPPIQIVLTKCDLVTQNDLARRVYLVRHQLSECLRREPSQLPVMLVSARTGLTNTGAGEEPSHPRGGLLELQKELAALVR